jgi:copper chaperone
MKTTFEIDNLKCTGCAGTIMKALKSFDVLQDPLVDVDNGTVSFGYPVGFGLSQAKEKLESLGYPEKGTLSGFKKVGANAMSYVSCAIGKMTTKEAS